MADLEKFWNKPHVQALIKATEKDEELSGHPTLHRLMERWKKKQWMITLSGNTFVGSFDKLEDFSNISYQRYLGHHEELAAMTVEGLLQEPLDFYTMPIHEIKIITHDELGATVCLYLYENLSFSVTAHLASFDCIN